MGFLGDFYGEISEEEKAETKKAMEQAPDADEGGFKKNKRILCAGRFKCKVTQSAYIYDGDLIRFPELKKSSSGHLMLVARLELVEKVGVFEVGDHVTLYQVFMAKAGTSAEDRQKIANFANARIKALIGGRDPEIVNPTWVHENLDMVVEVNGDKAKITRGHKMDGILCVTLKDGLDNKGNYTAEIDRVEVAQEDFTSELDTVSYESYKSREAAKAAEADEAATTTEGFGEAPVEETTVETSATTTPAVEDELPF